MSVRAALALVALVLGTLGTIAGRPAPAAAATDEVAWILSTVRPDGALATNPDQRLVWPYVANFAVMGLARRAAEDPAAARAGWRWLEWYQAHEDGNGYVTDHEVQDGALVSTGRMDSTDAYAGTYLQAAGELFAATGDSAALGRIRAGIDGAVRAIESTQDVDGLTWAKPDWHVKYLMDQSETYAGLLAAGPMAAALGDPGLAALAQDSSSRLRTGVAGLWNESTGAYDWAVHEGGGRASTDWAVLYPDAMQQAWVVAFGLDGGEHARQLVDHLQRSQPNWSQPEAVARVDATTGPVGFWPVGAWALRAAGRDPSAATAAMRDAADRAGRAWPFTSAIAGQLLVVESPPLVLPGAAPAGAVPDLPVGVVSPAPEVGVPPSAVADGGSGRPDPSDGDGVVRTVGGSPTDVTRGPAAAATATDEAAVGAAGAVGATAVPDPRPVALPPSVSSRPSEHDPGAGRTRPLLSWSSRLLSLVEAALVALVLSRRRHNQRTARFTSGNEARHPVLSGRA